MEQNNSEGDHRPWGCVFALLCVFYVLECVVVVEELFFMSFWHLLQCDGP